jgi:hypothetical protein
MLTHCLNLKFLDNVIFIKTEVSLLQEYLIYLCLGPLVCVLPGTTALFGFLLCGHSGMLLDISEYQIYLCWSAFDCFDSKYMRYFSVKFFVSVAKLMMYNNNKTTTETIVFCLCSFYKVLFMSHCRNQRALFVL